MTIQHLLHQLRPYVRLNNVTLVVAALVALSWLWGTVTTLQKNFVLQQEVDALDQQIQIAEIESATLGFQQQYYRSNEYLELQARAKLNKALPGEKLVILPLTPRPAPTPVKAPIAATTAPSNFQQWMRFLFGQQQ
jgi:cell division protein FtsB